MEQKKLEPEKTPDKFDPHLPTQKKKVPLEKMLDNVAKAVHEYKKPVEPEKTDVPKDHYQILMDVRAKLMYIAANAHNDELQQQANIAWQEITTASFSIKELADLRAELETVNKLRTKWFDLYTQVEAERDELRGRLEVAYKGFDQLEALKHSINIDRSHWKERAEKAEAERDKLKEENDDLNYYITVRGVKLEKDLAELKAENERLKEAIDCALVLIVNKSDEETKMAYDHLDNIRHK